MTTRHDEIWDELSDLLSKALTPSSKVRDVEKARATESNTQVNKNLHKSNDSVHYYVTFMRSSNIK